MLSHLEHAMHTTQKGSGVILTPADSNMDAQHAEVNTQLIFVRDIKMAKQRDTFSLGFSPVKVENLEIYLHDYPLLENASYLLSGFKFGFSLHYSGPRLPTDFKNLKSAIERPDILLQKIKKEIDAGRVAGPFKFRPIPTLRISPLGLVSKGKDGQFRVIHHLSYPEN